jgi:hypothetical protein
LRDCSYELRRIWVGLNWNRRFSAHPSGFNWNRRRTAPPSACMRSPEGAWRRS